MSRLAKRPLRAVVLVSAAAMLALGTLVAPTGSKRADASAPVLFADGFESGTLSAWSGGTGLLVQQQLVADGAWAARSTTTGAASYAYRTLDATTGELTIRLALHLVSIGGTSSFNFLKVRTASGTAIAELYITPMQILGLRNDVTGIATNSPNTVAAGVWHDVRLHIIVNGTTSTTEVIFDGATVPALTSNAANLGTTAVGRIQIGENVAGRTADLGFDTVTVAGPEPPLPPALFADGFESGTLSAWSGGTGLLVQQQLVADGAWAARSTTTGAASYAYRTLDATTGELTIRLALHLVSIGGTSSFNFLKVRTASGTAIAELYITPMQILGLRNDVTGIATNSPNTVAAGVWHDVRLHIIVNGTASTTEVIFDGATVPALTSNAANLGTTAVGRIQIGENVAGRTADLGFDTVTVTGSATSPDPVLAAAGDIACDPLNPNFNGGAGTSSVCHMMTVANLVLADPAITTVAALGDVQYECGGRAAFDVSYHPSWGRFKAITRPTVGNHEYIASSATVPATDCDPNATAAGYYTYFGAAAGDPAKGYYSYELGTWHVIVLNTTCEKAGGCGVGSPQEQWLRQDLAQHPVACTVAYFHIPLWSSGGRASPNARALVTALYQAGAELVLTGHDHVYERFAPQDPDGQPDPNGVRAFVVGTGGANHTSFTTIAANSEVRDATTFGILRLTLQPGGYAWTFVPEPGGSFRDSGSGSCH